jgi:hypothetical protein
MKSLIKKIGVFVLAVAFIVSTASTVLAWGNWIPGEGDGWEPTKAPWNYPGPDDD